MSKSPSKLSKVAKSFGTAVALVPLVGLLVETTTIPTANAQSVKLNDAKMWVIYYKTEIKKPIPGTWGAEMPIMEWYYDASSIKSVGHKRFVKTAFCGYRRWKSGEPIAGKLLCNLDVAERDSNIEGIDCKNNKFQRASGLMASPEWKAIAKDSGMSRLKMELCGS